MEQFKSKVEQSWNRMEQFKSKVEQSWNRMEQFSKLLHSNKHLPQLNLN